MQDVKPYPPEMYDGIWMVAGISIVVLVAVWIVLVLFITRKKQPKLLSSQRPREPVLPDIPALQAKYLFLIIETESQYSQKILTSRQVHQKLSLLLRFFVYEAKGVRAQVFTLSDLKRAGLPSVTSAIEEYYRPEFASVKTGDVPSALITAREVVTTWAS